MDAWQAAFDRKILAAVRLKRAILPNLRKGGWGRIVIISSLAGIMPPATGPDYSAAKAAINNLTLSLSKSVAGDGITVNSVSPGTIRSEKLEAAFRHMAQDHGVTKDASWAAVERVVMSAGIFAVPVQKVGQTYDIANAVAFLCSPLTGYITGIDL
ncbi:SDR family oxidoreductase [Asaia bogorensis]|uniref:SDR family oxidoreductase n=2 Tax=Asaia TaxID=91914 RepID=UPI001B7D78DC